MRGAGEPMFEPYFPPGSNMAGEVRNGPKAAERMEFELFSRLAMHDHVGWRIGQNVNALWNISVQVCIAYFIRP